MKWKGILDLERKALIPNDMKSMSFGSKNHVKQQDSNNTIPAATKPI